ncbi:GAF and ANTAR domain-containing protein [Pseudarthrobacter sp. AL07]|uniref:GAF and ANTAR domain-containing protein n=1 Tax=unclassified Pseudarthrobacter TaxID=2647000 RepID=UPI00249BC9D3|nr:MULTISPECIES: GAF and ANTAR domain-containing protein [unclassified Pseudarthrobacter]MDI3196198.1 GAF and ANTAR domain-containing protein [Pseudarthrobacter sp. AL20]MDI3210269.1 GAF and ANTAR domain-containing protein [Pseudarthrobacter sp. AL07]
MTNSPDHELILELQDLIIGTGSVADFLGGFAIIAAAALSRSTGATVECGVTLKRFKKTATVGGSTERAIHLDRIEQAVGEGPCLTAMRTAAPVLLADVRTDTRWPTYQKRLIEEGIHSVLGVPLELGETAAAALNFFAPATGVFTEDTVHEAARFADVARSAVRLAVRVGTAESAADDLSAAMMSRTAINLAGGIIMAQNRCSQAEAMAILMKVSSHRNQKLRDVADEIVRKVSGGEATTYFDL